MWGYDIQDIEISDKIRKCLLDEDSEEYLAYDEIERKELLFRLLQLFLLGGRLNQYEDNFGEYKELLKVVYKSLVNVKKDQSTDHVYVDTAVYDVKSVGGKMVFGGEPHCQNVCYVMINKGTRSLWLVYNVWVKW